MTPILCIFCGRKFTPITASPLDAAYCRRCLALRRLARWLARFSVRRVLRRSEAVA